MSIILIYISFCRRATIQMRPMQQVICRQVPYFATIKRAYYYLGIQCIFMKRIFSGLISGHMCKLTLTPSLSNAASVTKPLHSGLIYASMRKWWIARSSNKLFGTACFYYCKNTDNCITHSRTYVHMCMWRNITFLLGLTPKVQIVCYCTIFLGAF